MTGAVPETDLARLKALLFSAETLRLEKAETRIGALEAGRDAEKPAAQAPLPSGRQRERAAFARGWADHPVRTAAIGVALVAVLALILRDPLLHARKAAEIERALDAAKAADARLAAYPLSVSENWADARVDLRGLVPSRESMHRLVEALAPAVAPLALVPHVEVVASDRTLQSQEERAAKLAGALAAKSNEIDGLTDRIAAVERALAEARDAAEQKAKALSQTLADLRDQTAKAQEAAGLAAENGKTQATAIMTLAAGFDDLRAQFDARTGDGGASVAQDVLKLAAASAQAAVSLDAAAAGAAETARQLGDALARLAAQTPPNEIRPEFEAAKAQADKTALDLRALAQDAHRRAEAAAALQRALSPAAQ